MRRMGMDAMWVAMLAATVCLAGPPAGEVVVRPAPAPGPLDNPLKGWCPYVNAGPIRQPYSMVFLYAPWKDLEPEEGRYDFERWEAKSWSEPAARGKHVVFRVFVDYPGRPSGLPDWLKAQGIKQTRYTDHGGGLAPDYDDPRLLTAMERLIAALGRRYDADPRVGFVQLGLLGFWGEWHTWPVDTLYASRATERRVIEAYHRAFPHKLLMARTANHFAGEQPWLGYHDDMFPEDTDDGHDYSFLAGFRRAGRVDNWKVAAIGGEMVPHQAREWLGPQNDQTLAITERAHFTWVGPYCPALDRTEDPAFRARSEALVRRLGYQFRLDEVRHPATVAPGGAVAVAIRATNEGVAPFYYPWSVELGLVDAAGVVVARRPLAADVRTWLPGAFELKGEIPAAVPAVPAGRYSLALGIVDPMTARPAIRFANDLPVRDGWTILGTVDVGAGAAPVTTPR